MAAIGTLNGYVMLFDLRSNVISQVYQLNGEIRPILNLKFFYPYSGFSNIASDELIAVSYASNNHEIGVWELNTSLPVNEPKIVLSCENDIRHFSSKPILVNKTNEESTSMLHSKFSDRSYYDYVSHLSPHFDILEFYRDPVLHSQNQLKEKWLMNLKTTYSNIKSLSEYKNYAKSMILLPGRPFLRGPPQMQLRNMFITAGNDRNIRFWNLSNLPNEQLKESCVQVCNVDNHPRYYSQLLTGDIYSVKESTVKPIIEENESIFSMIGFSEKKPFYNGLSEYYNRNAVDMKLQQNNNPNQISRLANPYHRDAITDMIFVESPNNNTNYLISASMDRTIKVWR